MKVHKNTNKMTYFFYMGKMGGTGKNIDFLKGAVYNF